MVQDSTQSNTYLNLEYFDLRNIGPSLIFLGSEFFCWGCLASYIHSQNHLSEQLMEI